MIHKTVRQVASLNKLYFSISIYAKRRLPQGEFLQGEAAAQIGQRQRRKALAAPGENVSLINLASHIRGGSRVLRRFG